MVLGQPRRGIEPRGGDGTIEHSRYSDHAGVRRDHTTRSDLSDRPITLVSHEQIACGIQQNALGKIESCVRSATVGAANAGRTSEWRDGKIRFDRGNASGSEKNNECGADDGW